MEQFDHESFLAYMAATSTRGDLPAKLAAFDELHALCEDYFTAHEAA